MKKRRLCFRTSRNHWEKSWKMMRMFVVFMCAMTLSASASVYAQNERVTLDFINTNMKHVLHEIQRQTHLSFIFQTEQTEQIKGINVKAKNESVSSLLDRILANTGLSWKIQGDMILITKSTPQQVAGQQSQSQEMLTFTGTVTDDQKNPLPGVTVKIRGATIGTSTDVNGKFKLTYPKNNDNIVLEFSFVGMQTTSVKYAGQKEINVILYEEKTELEEVVVTGYQVLNRRTQTSAITSVKAEDIMIPGVTSIDQMLEGRIPDMAFMLNSGEVGATPRLRVRGTSPCLATVSRYGYWTVLS